MPTSHGLPPYSELIFYNDVLQRLTAGEVKLLCWLIGNVTPAGEGSWSVSISMSLLEQELGMTAKTLRKHITGLVISGYVTVTKSVAQGRGMGATAQTYYLVHHPSLRPPSGEPPSQKPVRQETSSPGNYSPGNLSPEMKGRLYRLPVPAGARGEGKSPQGENPASVVLEESTNTTTLRGKDSLEPATRSALVAVGWNFEAFDVPDVAEELLLAGARYAKRNRLGAAWLNSTIKSGALADIIRGDGALGHDPNGVLSTPERLDGYQFDTLAQQDPEWAEAVKRKAREQVPPGKEYIPPSLLWKIGWDMRGQVRNNHHPPLADMDRPGRVM